MHGAIESILLGKTESHLLDVKGTPHFLHKEVVEAFYQLQAAASHEGFQIELASAFRSYDRQVYIWNQKATGKRPLLDSQGNALEFATLSTEEIVFSILRWSALPGASRHHWGTDFDVFDQKAVPPGYRVALTPEEVANQGIFGPLHQWLDKEMSRFGFFRPYQTDRGGVNPERWHLSYAPVAEDLMKKYSLSLFEHHLQTATFELIDEVRLHATTIFNKFIHNIDRP